MREMWNKTWDVNVTGTYILTHSLMPLILASSDPRILFLTSGTATLAVGSSQSKDCFVVKRAISLLFFSFPVSSQQ